MLSALFNPQSIAVIDRIVVLEGGRIGEIGSHAELIPKQGRYAQLHALQFSA